MPQTLVEAMGAVGQTIFVPADVLSSQDENLKMLQQRADRINNSPQIIANAQADPKVAATLQAMNRDVYLSSKADQEAGSAILNSLYDSIAEIPKNLKDAVTETGASLGSGISGAVPTWLRILLGVALVAAILYFLSPLIRKASA